VEELVVREVRSLRSSTLPHSGQSQSRLYESKKLSPIPFSFSLVSAFSSSPSRPLHPPQQSRVVLRPRHLLTLLADPMIREPQQLHLSEPSLLREGSPVARVLSAGKS